MKEYPRIITVQQILEESEEVLQETDKTGGKLSKNKCN